MRLTYTKTQFERNISKQEFDYTVDFDPSTGDYEIISLIAQNYVNGRHAYSTDITEFMTEREYIDGLFAQIDWNDYYNDDVYSRKVWEAESRDNR
jgi:hypothetical protein